MIRKITIYDIAKRLNISATTVSRSLNNKEGVGITTRELVKRTAMEMNYTANNIASSLRKQSTKTIGVVVSRINRPFISAMISGMEEIANDEKYFILISQTIDSFEKEKEILQSFISQKVDGIIISLAMETTTYDHIFQANKAGIPIVIADRISPELKFDKVAIDNYQSSYNATKHLIKKGHREIAYFSGSTNQYIYKERKEGFLKALNDSNILFDDTLLFEGVLTAEEGRENMKAILNRNTKPTAVFGTNDTSIVEAMIYAIKEGVKIPSDIAFVGFNDDPISQIVSPLLTTISVPAKEIGRKSAELLLKRVKSPQLKTVEIILKTKLVERASSDKILSAPLLYKSEG